MPWYRVGSVAITAGQNTVTGTGTNFSTNARVGDAFQGPDGRWYEVTNIASGTVLSIMPAYQGATVSAGAYGLAPMQGYVKESADRLRQLVDQWGSTLAGLGTVSTENVVPVEKGGTGATAPPQARTALGLGTAATRNVTATSTDTTAGSVLKVGDFAIGGGMPLPTPNSADAVTATGFYITNGATTGTPGTAEGLSANAQGYLCHYQNLNPAYAVQEWFLVAVGSDRYTRSKHNGNWGMWNRVQYAATAVTTFGDQEIGGTKTLTGAQLRFKGGTPGMWMEEGGTATGIWMVLNGGTMQFQHRATGFGGTAGLTPLAMNINTQTTRSGYQLTPAVDNSAAMQLGASNYRWPVVYAATGTINTSDAREKTPVAAMSASEIAAAKELSREIGTYKWLQAVAEKGDEARVHIGMTVQRAMEIMAGHGLDPMAYGFVCYDQWEAVEEVAITERYGKLYSLNKVTGEKEYAPDDRDVQEWEASPGTGIHWEFRYESVNTITPGSPAGDRYSFRYDELNMFIAAGIEARLSALEDAA